MTQQMIKVGDILKGDLFPERIRVLTVQYNSQQVVLESVGCDTKQYYSHILSLDDLAEVEIESALIRQFDGNAEAFFLAMEAQRIRFAHQFDPLFAISVSQVDPLPHQIDAVYNHILRNSRIRFLLADDPGAGKTIMAGLLLKELKYRGLVHRTLIVVPGHLKDQWQREMKERFSEPFMLVDRGTMNATWGRNIWQDEAQIITSMDFAKQDDVLGALGETHWDLIIVDEAHKMAAYRYGDKTTKTDRYRLGERLSKVSQYMLLLTATPHRGDPENFRLFLELLEPGLFANKYLLLESIEAGDNPLFLRRLKEDLRDFENRPLFPPRHVFTRPYRLNDDEKRLYNAVTEYVEKSYNKALVDEKRNVAFALLILQRRLASSIYAVRRSLERRLKRLQELLELGKWYLEKGDLDTDEDFLEDAPEAERLRIEEELIERLTAAKTREELESEINTLKELLRLAYEAERREIETKLSELRKVMEDEHLQQSREKLLVFTESRETMEYLNNKLKSWGYSVVTLHGGLNLDARIHAEHEFREHAQVMVSTEAGGEGINLQFCSLMVNYDIPWNPNRLEQRMGRIHRYGQQKEVHIYNLVASDTREGKVLRALFEKLQRIQEALGTDRVFDVIGELVPGKSLKDLIVDAISNRRTLDDIVNEINTLPDSDTIQKVREATFEALATRHIDLQHALGEDRRAKENRLVPEYIERFFERSCRFLDMSFEKRRDGLWRIPSVPYELRNISTEFKQKFGEVFREYNKIAFDKKQARKLDAVFVAPGHPLLETIIDAVLEKSQQHVQTGAVFADPDGKLDGWLWFVQGEVRDGNYEVAGKRLYVLYQPKEDSEIRPVQSAILWDLKPLPAKVDSVSLTTDEISVISALSPILNAYREELLQERIRETEIKQKYGISSLDHLIAETESKLIDYEVRGAQGEPIPEAEITNERRRKEEYEQRKKELEQDIRRRKNLTLSKPNILGVAAVVPLPVDQTDVRPDAQIEIIGMQFVLEYERNHGRTPHDVSAENLGYDIRSESSDGTLRYIEVKTRATTGSIVLTPNEWLMATRLGPEYWLYIVENAATQPTLHTIQDPATKLQPREMTQVVRYIVDDWKTASEEA